MVKRYDSSDLRVHVGKIYFTGNGSEYRINHNGILLERGREIAEVDKVGAFIGNFVMGMNSWVENFSEEEGARERLSQIFDSDAPRFPTEDLFLVFILKPDENFPFGRAIRTSVIDRVRH